ncbi:GntR family transcriptional regulator [Sutcliffiella rhizosphaerae]|uniref:HTH-type transcriptional repressor NagR n=1 Tax=Sutcliffiella rhizosphaerae TaxID=2880967 RepID=A0ABN8A6X5_9BACI|nr:GntR family transcriptional regulator [Sutcliffiella rhizosphaerae]CAG9619652.1 HTH-type transcriptional repressor NagR [Sutcliffiella rhizosphaerae]
MSIRSDSRHLYLLVVDKLKQDIENKVYKEKEKLPSEFELSRSLGISRATLREALRVLEEENIVVRRHGVGTFVNSKPVFSSGIEQLNSVTEMISQAGMKPGTVFLTSTIETPSEEELKKFGNDEINEMLHFERVRTANDQPVVYCIDKIPTTIVEDYHSYKNESLLDLLEEQAGRYISYAVTHIEPIGYHDKISPILECEPETALLVLKQMHYDQNDEPILYSLNYFRADKFSFHVLRKRP